MPERRIRGADVLILGNTALIYAILSAAISVYDALSQPCKTTFCQSLLK